MRAKVQKHQACNYFLLQLCGERRCQCEVHTGCAVPVKTFYQFAQKHDVACFNRPLLCSVCSSVCPFYLLFQYNGITNTVRTTLLNIAHGNLFDFQLLEESEFCFSLFVFVLCVSQPSYVLLFFFGVLFFILLERQMIQQLCGTR